MTQKQLNRHDIIKRLIRKEINGTMAACLMHLSVRQTKRLKAKVLRYGPSALQHGNKGQSGHNKIPAKEEREIIKLLHKHYYDFGPTFASEKLEENHGVKRDPNTIRRIMIVEKLWKPKNKKKEAMHRSWRQRKDCYGEMLQFDGSYEHWLEDRGGTGEMCLLAAIDDATGKAVKATFDEHEGVLPVMSFWQEYIQENGKPNSIYLDKFSTYSMNHKLAKENSDTLTQFQRALDELWIEPILANSPQAKGRVERLFKTFQDRLIKELRLANISTMKEANEFLKQYLPKYNAKFAVQPHTKTNLHKQLTKTEKKKLPGILSRQKQRTLQNDYTLSLNKQWFQITKNQPINVYKKDKVIVEERTDNTIQIRLRGKYLNYRILPARPPKQKDNDWVIPKTQEQINQSKAHKPAANHPWKQRGCLKTTVKQKEPGMTF
ncbi:MAG TPA: ISNCY family transposase [Patescibacteria group bacterium]